MTQILYLIPGMDVQCCKMIVVLVPRNAVLCIALRCVRNHIERLYQRLFNIHKQGPGNQGDHKKRSHRNLQRIMAYAAKYIFNSHIHKNKEKNLPRLVINRSAGGTHPSIFFSPADVIDVPFFIPVQELLSFPLLDVFPLARFEMIFLSRINDIYKSAVCSIEHSQINIRNIAGLAKACQHILQQAVFMSFLNPGKKILILRRAVPGPVLVAQIPVNLHDFPGKPDSIHPPPDTLGGKL